MEGLTSSTCDRRTRYSLFCRGSAAVRSSCGIEASRWELITPRRDAGVMVMGGLVDRGRRKLRGSASGGIGWDNGRNPLIR